LIGENYSDRGVPFRRGSRMGEQYNHG